MGLSFWHIVVVLLVVLIVFGAGKLPQVMGDLAKGVKAFKAGLKDEESAAPPAAPAQIVPPPAATATPAATPAHPVETVPPHHA